MVLYLLQIHHSVEILLQFFIFLKIELSRLKNSWESSIRSIFLIFFCNIPFSLLYNLGRLLADAKSWLVFDFGMGHRNKKGEKGFLKSLLRSSFYFLFWSLLLVIKRLPNFARLIFVPNHMKYPTHTTSNSTLINNYKTL